MSRRQWRWAGLPLLLGALVALALTGCGITSPIGAKPTATPNAQTILQRAQAVQINDLSFKMTLDSTFAGTAATGSGTGTVTKSPQRVQLSLTLNSGSTSFTLQEIADVATSTAYTKISGLDLPGFSGDKWTKSSLGTMQSLFDTSQLTDYSKIQNAKLAGAETLNGTTVWHLTGTSSSSGVDAAYDLYLRQDNYYPVKSVVKTTGADQGTITIDYTGVNTGTTIALPPASEVQSGSA